MRRPATNGEHRWTVVFGLWMTVGLFLDGYFHQNLETEGESFLTLWHAVFYSGFFATATWLVVLSDRRAPGRRGLTARYLPPGYESARVGLVLFAVGGVGDGIWHTVFGVEKGIDALLSPTHLLLFCGLVLLLRAPVDAARAVPDDPPSSGVLLGSLLATTALVGFFLNFVWGLGISEQVRTVYDPVSETGEVAVIAGIGSTVVTTVVLFGAVQLWLGFGRRLPGAAVVLFGVTATLVSAAFDEDIEGVLAAVVAGVVLELLRHRVDRRVAFGAAAAVLWLGYFGLLGSIDGLEWHAELWAGAVVLNVLVAVALAHVDVLGRAVTRPRPEPVVSAARA